MIDGRPLPEPALVGRQHELETIFRQLEESTTGRLRVVFVSGEPGIGKTRLLQEVAWRAEKSGTLVLRGGSSEAEGMPPYLPFLEALGQYIRATTSDVLCEQTGEMASVLTTILPELPARLLSLPSSYPLPPEQARLRLYEAVGAFLAAIAAPHGLVLLLDDLQWADTATLDLLCYVAQHQATARLCFLGAYRSDELANHPALERSIMELTRSRQLMTLALGPLPETDVAELITVLVGVPPHPSLSQLLWQKSEGSPLYLEELLRAWLETGVLTLTPSHIHVSSSPEHRLPTSISSLIRQRFSRLPKAVLETLHTAAILGRTFTSGLLAEIMGQDEELVQERLITAVQAGLLHYETSEDYTFSHDLLRAYLYNEVTPARRRRLHGFIGRVLEAQPDHEYMHQLAQLAYHFAHSGDRVRGATYCRLAAVQAVRAAAPSEATHLYGTALELLDQNDQQRGALLMALGEAALTAGKEREAVQAFEAAKTWFTHSPDVESAARSAYGLGRAHARLEEHAAAQTTFRQALTLLQEHACPEKILILVELATLLAVSLGQHSEGMAYGQQALSLARELGDNRLEAMARRVVGNVLVRSNDLPTGIALLEDALALADSVQDLPEASECCACLTLAYFWSGKVQQMKEILQRRLELARRGSEPYQLRHIYPWLAGCAMGQADFSEAEQWLSQAEVVIASLASPEPRAFLLHIRGALAALQQEYDAAVEQLEQAAAIFRQLGSGMLLWYLPLLGWVQLRRGLRQEALACLKEAELLLTAHESGTILTGDAIAKLANIALLLEDRERIARYFTLLQPFQGLFLDELVDRVLGQLSTYQGNWSQANAFLEKAEIIARREGLPLELLETLKAQAQLELSRGGKGSAKRASSCFEQALHLAEQLGLSREAAGLHEQLQQMPKRSYQVQSRVLPAGLSEREVEVLGLVAKGASNRQIAEALVLSERTVSNHLFHIFNKLGVDNRAAATAFAIKHKLA
jgi:predicted ATPase/DNA-binding CsgD family transcriptional regulator